MVLAYPELELRGMRSRNSKTKIEKRSVQIVKP